MSKLAARVGGRQNIFQSSAKGFYTGLDDLCITYLQPCCAKSPCSALGLIFCNLDAVSCTILRELGIMFARPRRNWTICRQLARCGDYSSSGWKMLEVQSSRCPVLWPPLPRAASCCVAHNARRPGLARQGCGHHILPSSHLHCFGYLLCRT